MFPRKSNKKPRNGDSAPELTSKAAQNVVAELFPIKQAQPAFETMDLEEARQTQAFRTLRIERCNARMIGIRARNARIAAEQAAIKASKKKKK